jgi:hypothetical protein
VYQRKAFICIHNIALHQIRILNKVYTSWIIAFTHTRFFPVAIRPYFEWWPPLTGLQDHNATAPHNWQDSPGRVISQTQRLLLDNTQQSQETDNHTSGRIPICDPTRRVAAHPFLKPRGHWDRELHALCSSKVLHKLSRLQIFVAFLLKCKGTDKAIPLQTLRVPEAWGSQILRQSAHVGGKLVSLTSRPPLPLRNIPGIHFCYRLSRPQSHCAAGRIMSTKNSNDTIANRSRDHPVCCALPQPLRHRVSPFLNVSSYFL